MACSWSLPARTREVKHCPQSRGQINRATGINSSDSVGQWTSHRSYAAVARSRGQPPARIRSRSGMPKIEPCSSRRRSVRSHPRRGQARQAISIVAVLAATSTNRIDRDTSADRPAAEGYRCGDVARYRYLFGRRWPDPPAEGGRLRQTQGTARAPDPGQVMPRNTRCTAAQPQVAAIINRDCRPPPFSPVNPVAAGSVRLHTPQAAWILWPPCPPGAVTRLVDEPASRASRRQGYRAP